MASRKVLLTSLLVGILAMSACANTIRGIGRDAGSTVNATGDAARTVARSG